MDWIDLAENRDMRRAVMHSVTNLQVLQHVGNFLTG